MDTREKLDLILEKVEALEVKKRRKGLFGTVKKFIVGVLVLAATSWGASLVLDIKIPKPIGITHQVVNYLPGKQILTILEYGEEVKYQKWKGVWRTVPDATPVESSFLDSVDEIIANGINSGQEWPIKRGIHVHY